jgi:hypothetical protein
MEEFKTDIGVDIDIQKFNDADEKKYQDENEKDLQLGLPDEAAAFEAQPQNMDIQPPEPDYIDVPLSIEEVRERSKLLNSIRNAKIQFPRHWHDMGIPDEMIERSSTEELKLIHDDFKFRRDSIDSFRIWYALINRGILLGEAYSGAIGLELGGLSKRLEENEEYTDALKAVLHDNLDKLQLTPMKRLCCAFISTAAAVHTENTALKNKDEYEDI